jgi:glutamyl-tRNA reductase
VEIYTLVRDVNCGKKTVQKFLTNFFGTALGAVHGAFFQKTDLAAVEHLFAVTAGINSMVVGETQIKGQVKQAFETAKEFGSVGSIFSTLFQNALTVGKRVRNETAIGEASLSVSHAAAALIEESFENLAGLHALIIGIGKMSLLTINALKKRGLQDITIVNRSEENARKAADELDVEAFGFEKLSELLTKADIVVSSTGAPHIVLSEEMMRGVVQRRQAKPLFIVDIAVPRDVEPEVGRLDGVRLFNIDQLEGRIQSNLAQRCNEISKVRQIVAEEVIKFQHWYQTLEVKPVIKQLRQRSEEIREQELELAVRKLDTTLSEDELQVVRDLSRRIVNKLLHEPFSRLRHEATIGNGHNYTATVRSLFGLTETSDM